MELDRPIFEIVQNIDKEETRQLESDLADIVTLSGKETTLLNAQIGAAIVKKHAQKVLSDTTSFISNKQQADTTILRSAIPDGNTPHFYAPCCYIQTTADNGTTDTQLLANSLLPDKSEVKILEQIGGRAISLNSEEHQMLSHFFSTELENSDLPHRVKSNIAKLYNKSFND